MRMSTQQLKRKLVETSPKAARPPLKQQYRQEEAQKPKMQRHKMVDNLELSVCIHRSQFLPTKADTWIRRTWLGTSSAAPGKTRNTSGSALKLDGEVGDSD